MADTVAQTAINLTDSAPVHASGLNLSLLKMSTIAQVIAGVAITTAVVVSTVVATTVFVATVKYDNPICRADTAVTYKKTPVPIYVLANDEDPRQSPLTVESVTQGTFGIVRISQDNTFVIYTPNPGYAGIDTFNYTAKNDKLSSSAAVKVTILNRAPFAVDQSYEINKNSQNNQLNVFDYKHPETNVGISDIDDDVLSLTSCTPASFGQLTVNERNVFYTPNYNFNGKDSVNCTISDKNDTASFIISLTVFNSAPIAYPDIRDVPKNTIATVDVLSNDLDINNDELNTTWVGNVGMGNARIMEDNKLVEYLPIYTTASTTDSFEYTCTDGFFSSSSYVVLNLKNTPPTAKDVQVSNVAKNSGAITVTLRQCTSPSQDPKDWDFCDVDRAEVLKVTVQPPVGVQSTYELQEVATKVPAVYGLDKFISLDKFEYKFVFTPKAGQQYTESFTYTVTDSGRATASAKINIAVINKPPVAPTLVGQCAKRLTATLGILNGSPVPPSDPDGDQLSVASVSPIPGTTKGSVSLSNGQAAYTAPADGFTGVDTFSYTVSDGSLTASGQFQVTVFNQAPVANPDTVTVQKGIATNIPVLANDQDPNGDAISVNAIDETAEKATVAKVTVSGVDQVQYTSIDKIGTDTFYYNNKDNEGLVSANKALVTVTILNTAPVANGDSYSVYWNTTTVFTVLVNDDDINPGDKQILEIVAVSAPSNGGSASSSDKKTISYSPARGFTGTETFTYTVKDRYDTSAPATVTVTVVNPAPIANPDTATKHHALPSINIDVLANDSDPQNDPLYILSTSSARATIVVVNGKQFIQYASPAGFTGVDTFTYTITDFGVTATASVSVTVTDTAPTANPDSATLHWKSTTPITIPVLANDVDADSDPMTLVSVSTPNRGSAVVSGSDVVYTGPGAGFKGTVTFTYQVSDGALQSTGTVTVTITNNDVPVAPAITRNVHWSTQVAGISIPLMSALVDSDGDTDTLTFSATQQGGVVTKNADNLSVTYKKQNWVGTDSFTYTISDGLDSATGTVTVTVFNNAPVAQTVSATVTPVERLSGILINVMDAKYVSDADGDTVTLVSIGTSPRATITLENGRVKYVPIGNNAGPDTFTYTVTDGLAQTTGTVNVDVIAADLQTTYFTYNILWSTQTTGSTYTFTQNINSLQTQATNGVCTRLSSSQIKYQQNANYLGTDSCTFFFTNEQSTQNKLQIFFNVYDNAPAVNAFSQSIHWRSLLAPGVTLNVLNGATDADGDTVSLQAVGTATKGTPTRIGNSVTYVATAKFLGTDSFTFTATDGLLNVQNTATITSINPTVPTATNIDRTIPWRTFGSTGTTFNILSSLNDADGDSLTITITSVASGSTATIVNNGLSILVQKSNFVGREVVRYKISDGMSESSEGVLSIVSTNALPVTTADTYTFHWRSLTSAVTLTPNPIANDSDPDSDPISYSSLGSVFTLGGSASLSNGNVVYTAPSGKTGRDTFSYFIRDSLPSSAVSGTINVDITNTAPVAPAVTVETLWRNTATVTPTCTDANSDPIVSYAVNVAPTSGTFSFAANSNVGTYTPTSPVTFTGAAVNGKFSRSDVFSYRCSDSIASTVGSITVNVYNNAPVANPDSFTFVRDVTSTTPRILDVLANDVDADQDTIVLNGNPTASSGSQVVISNNRLSYTPSAAFSGTDTITYFIFDGNRASITPGVATVNMQNTPPTCTASVYNNVVKQSTIRMVLVCTDANNDPLTYSLQTPATHTKGSILASGVDPTTRNFFVDYRSNAGRSGADVVSVRVSDGFATITSTMTANIVNNGPSTVSPSYSVSKSQTDREVVPNFAVLTGATDPNAGDSIVLQSVAVGTCGTAAGTFSVSGNNVRYVQKGGYTGSCSFQFTYRDSDQDNPVSVTATATLAVTNSAPVAINDYFTTDQNTQIVISTTSLMANDYDLENDTLTFDGVVCTQPGVTCTKAHTYTAPTSTAPGYITIAADESTCGQIAYQYRIRTADGLTSTAFFYVKYVNCRCVNPVDIIFILDGSGSIAGTDWTRALNFVRSMVDRFTFPSTQVAIVQFSTSASITYNSNTKYGFNFQNSNAATIKTMVSNLVQFKSNTHTLSGFRLALQTAQSSTARAGVPKTFVLVTDGAPNMPCSCSQCTSFYGQSSNCTRPEWPGLTCSNCGWSPSSFPDSLANPTRWCMPCSDFRSFAQSISAISSPKMRVVSIGIGDIGGLGSKIIKESATTESNSFFPTDWNNLNAIYQSIVDETCN